MTVTGQGYTNPGNRLNDLPVLSGLTGFSVEMRRLILQQMEGGGWEPKRAQGEGNPVLRENL